MIHKLVWMVLDQLKDVLHFHFNAPDFTKSAAETFIIKTLGDRAKIVPRIEEFKGNQPIAIIQSISETDKIEAILAEAKEKLAKTESKNTYILLHGLFKPESKATLQANLAKSYVE